MPNLIWYLILGPAVCWFPSNFKYPIIILEAPKPFIRIRFGLSEKRGAHSIHSRFPLLFDGHDSGHGWRNHPEITQLPLEFRLQGQPTEQGQCHHLWGMTGGPFINWGSGPFIYNWCGKTKESTSHFGGFIQPISGGVGDGYFGYGTWWNKRWDFRNGNILGDIAKHVTGIPPWHSMAWPHHKKTVWEAQKSILITSVPSVPITWAPNTFVGRAGWHGLHTSVAVDSDFACIHSPCLANLIRSRRPWQTL